MASTETRNVRLYLVAVVVTLTIYVVFDLDYPRFGIIRLDFADQGLLDLLADMK